LHEDAWSVKRLDYYLARLKVSLDKGQCRGWHGLVDHYRATYVWGNSPQVLLPWDENRIL